jgi:hypothetical protein
VDTFQKKELLFEEVPESNNECYSEKKAENINESLRSQIKESSFTVSGINSDQSSNRPITREVKYTSPIRDTFSRGSVNQEPPAR